MKQKQNEESIIVLKSGTIVKYKGIPCELCEDVPVYSKSINCVIGEAEDINDVQSKDDLLAKSSLCAPRLY